MPSSTLSVIIPALNEASHISKILSRLSRDPQLEIIVVDGGSRDGTADMAASFGVRVLSSAGGKSGQMNLGAKKARGARLLFLHADTMLPFEFRDAVMQCLEEKGVAAGAFRLRIDMDGLGIRLIERFANLRARMFQMPYGDQALFLRTELFHGLGGYPDMPFMEDFALARRLRKEGRITILPLAAVTSGRRWQRHGIIKTTIVNQLVVAGYILGIPPSLLYRLYHGRRAGR